MDKPQGACRGSRRAGEGWRKPGPSTCRCFKGQQNTDGEAMASKEQRALLEEQCSPSGRGACMAAGLMAVQPKALSLTWTGRGTRCVGRDTRAGLNAALPVKQLISPCWRKAGHISSPQDTKSTSACSCLPPFGALFAWARDWALSQVSASEGMKWVVLETMGWDGMGQKWDARGSSASEKLGSSSQGRALASNGGGSPVPVEPVDQRVPVEVLKAEGDRSSLAESSPNLLCCYYPIILGEAEYFTGNIGTILGLLYKWALRLVSKQGLTLRVPLGDTTCAGENSLSPALQHPCPLGHSGQALTGELVVKLEPGSSWAGAVRDLPAGSWAIASKNWGCKSQCSPSQLQRVMQLRTKEIWRRGFSTRADVSGAVDVTVLGRFSLWMCWLLSENRHLQFVWCACTRVGGPQFPSRISCMLNMAKDSQGFFSPPNKWI